MIIHARTILGTYDFSIIGLTNPANLANWLCLLQPNNLPNPIVFEKSKSFYTMWIWIDLLIWGLQGGRAPCEIVVMGS